MGMKDSGPHQHHTESSIVTLNYDMLRSPGNTTFPHDAPVKELHFELTGNMKPLCMEYRQPDPLGNG